jgi:hypothetical protein
MRALRSHGRGPGDGARTISSTKTRHRPDTPSWRACHSAGIRSRRPPRVWSGSHKRWFQSVIFVHIRGEDVRLYVRVGSRRGRGPWCRTRALLGGVRSAAPGQCSCRAATRSSALQHVRLVCARQGRTDDVTRTSVLSCATLPVTRSSLRSSGTRTSTRPTPAGRLHFRRPLMGGAARRAVRGSAGGRRAWIAGSPLPAVPRAVGRGGLQHGPRRMGSRSRSRCPDPSAVRSTTRSTTLGCRFRSRTRSTGRPRGAIAAAETSSGSYVTMESRRISPRRERSRRARPNSTSGGRRSSATSRDRPSSRR